MSHGSLPPPLPPFSQTPPFAQVAPIEQWAVQAPPPAALRPARFSLHWYAFAMTGVWVAVEIWKTWPVALVRATAPEMAPAYFAGSCVGVLLIVLGLTYFVWRVTRCSRAITTLVFCCLLTTCILIVLQPSLVGPSKATVQKMEADITSPMQSKMDAARALAGQVRSAGAIRFRLEDLSSPQEIDRRIALLDRSEAACEDILKTGDSFDSELSRRLQGAGFSPQQRADVVREFQQQYKWSQGQQRASRAVLVYLKQHLGDWTFDPSSDAPRLSRPELADSFVPIWSEYQSALAEQHAIR